MDLLKWIFYNMDFDHKLKIMVNELLKTVIKCRELNCGFPSMVI